MIDHWGTDAAPELDDVLAALPQTIVRVDRDSRLVAVNRPESPVFNRRPVLGEGITAALQPEAENHIGLLVESARRTGRAEVEYDTGALLYRVTACLLNKAGQTLVVFQDVTARKNAERMLMELAMDKSGVLASVSDDLRSPLGAVMSYADLLLQPGPALDESARAAMIRDMTDQAWNLAGLVEDLLTVAHTEIGDLKVVRVPVNLSANTAQVIESMGDRADRLMVTGDKSITGVGDPARFRQIVRNLLSNALSHGSEPIAVGVSIDGGHAVLSVKDRGPGVPAHLESEIFTRLVTSRDPATPNRAGIGLWISRELAGLMGGYANYQREHGLTVFRVAIPRLERV